MHSTCLVGNLLPLETVALDSFSFHWVAERILHYRLDGALKLETRFDCPYKVTNVKGLNVTVSNVEYGTKRKRINPHKTI
ncbi:hypothetical protein PPL_10788 [Heterostelium album PN500]|uniref:Uncharacterized protein n=1 Tax=Heterostelium pallidum (strain ATCC 26659 / Pp 5 / PN500) TaxID=670386 RepID=D3BRZ8_HETP5|nr:hypothetical protein PPL_10788 [Heterostelium album PN500]EFA75735.1 hypothetical protein PPL_10788 [Heterostelium album PN500]|eukprot:XP_020427869.1 hypothetical protein PPL_10788 [Heterostelium album PN500]